MNYYDDCDCGDPAIGCDRCDIPATGWAVALETGDPWGDDLYGYGD